jgi:hypothetical protein
MCVCVVCVCVNVCVLCVCVCVNVCVCGVCVCGVCVVCAVCVCVCVWCVCVFCVCGCGALLRSNNKARYTNVKVISASCFFSLYSKTSVFTLSVCLFA